MAVSVAKGNAAVCTTNAERISVSKTSGAAGDSAVKSVTQNLRVAYPGVECNITNV
tara:strand:+ start:323 stop:490 length:168 start_codon:yes stop_codon:yes gene_type:complete